MGRSERRWPAAAATSTPRTRHSANGARVSNAIKHKVGRGTSTNWSGYAVDGSSATNVVGICCRNFGSVAFSAASATIDNQTAALGSLGADPITMITSQGQTTRAKPSAISGGTSFNVTWQHS